MDALDEPVTLCCLLWARPGEEAGLREYEDRVLAYVPEHGGTVVQRASGDGADGRPHEVQLYRFDTRLALAPRRDRVVGRTDLFPVELVGPAGPWAPDHA